MLLSHANLPFSPGRRSRSITHVYDESMSTEGELYGQNMDTFVGGCAGATATATMSAAETASTL